jgi:hypothetical protein
VEPDVLKERFKHAIADDAMRYGVYGQALDATAEIMVYLQRLDDSERERVLATLRAAAQRGLFE